MSLLSEVTLEGRFVRLEPLRRAHLEALFAAASEPGADYTLTSVPPSPEAMRAYLDFACEEMAKGRALAFATVDAHTGRVVGSTRFANPEVWKWPREVPLPVPDGPDAIEIGWTWLARSAQRTPINTEAKLLMLGHALETCRLRRVTLKTDVRNVRSRAAMERLGLRFDGVLRAHMPASDGGVRDSAYYSVLQSEWPELRDRLQRSLERDRREPPRVERAAVGDALALSERMLEAESRGGASRQAVLTSRLASGLGSGQLSAFLVREGAEVVAFCALERDGSAFAEEGEARLWLQVREGAHERGLEEALARTALAHAKESGVRRLRLHASSPERSVFTRLGFQSELDGMTMDLSFFERP